MKSGVFFTVKTVQGAVVEGNRTNRGLFSRSQQQNRHTLVSRRLKRFGFGFSVLRMPPYRDHSRRQLRTYLSPPPILAMSIWRKKLCNLSTILLVQSVTYVVGTLCNTDVSGPGPLRDGGGGSHERTTLPQEQGKIQGKLR
jgi:hypothetical protein